MNDVSPTAPLAAMSALAARDYPEIGVPTFLVFGDRNMEAVETDPDQLAIEFAALTMALATARPALGESDIGQLMEYLADCYFFDFASPRFSTNAALHPVLER